MAGESSDDRVLRARKNLAAIFQRLSEVGQSVVAQRLSVSDATISRWKTEEGELAAKILAELGLKVVPIGLKCFDPAKIGAILQLAKAHLADIEGPEQLSWEE